MNEYKTIKKTSKIILPVKFKTYVQMCKRVSKFEILEQATFLLYTMVTGSKNHFSIQFSTK